ncbi:MAG: helix-turn-helix domain-containing protein [Verrucomicrobia bacterium]|nr:helix-turn-helix domain-containing protein [Verrucomicrobiota bacterium]
MGATASSTCPTDMENPSLGFVGIFIPRDLWLRADLSVTEKVLAGVVDALDKGDGCWASNAYLANTVGVGERQIRDYLARLEEAKILKRWTQDGNRRISSTYSKPSNSSSVEENSHPPRKETAANRVVDKVKDNKNKSVCVSEAFCKFFVEVTDKATESFCLFIVHRQEIKRPLTQRALEGNVEIVKAEAEKHGITFTEAAKEMVDASIRNGWYGLFPVRKASPHLPKKQLTSEDHKNGF